MPQFQVRSIARGRHYYRMIAEGFKVCRSCELMVKTDALLCPFCSKKFKTRTADHAKSEVLATMKKIMNRPKVQRVCVDCGTNHAPLALKNGGTYERWCRNGNGGYRCNSCHRKSLRKANPEKFRKQQQESYLRNQDKRREADRIRKQKPAYKAMMKAYRERNKHRLAFMEKLRAYNPLNLKLPKFD